MIRLTVEIRRLGVELMSRVVSSGALYKFAFEMEGLAKRIVDSTIHFEEKVFEGTN